MRLLGILVLAAGIAVGLFGLAMDTSVTREDRQRGYIGMRDAAAEEEVTDPALVSKQKVWLWAGGFLAVAGLAMAVAGGGSRPGDRNTPDGLQTGGGDDEWMVEHELTRKKKGVPQPVHKQQYEEEEDDEVADEEYMEDEEEESNEDHADNVHSITETLIKLNELRKEGVLTEEEFNVQKAKLLRQR